MNKSKLKIGIVGYGYVGKAVADFFKVSKYTLHQSIHSINTYDITGFPSMKEYVNDSDIAFVCVPTESNEKGECDTSAVEEVLGWLKTPLIVIKSTVSPGTTDRLVKETGKRIVFSPEFIGEPTYHTEDQRMLKTPFHIFGGSSEDTKKLVEIYQRIAGPSKQYIQTDSKTAEMTKYTLNTFLATKLTFCYEFDQITRAHQADYNKVRDLWLLDPRISSSHTSVFHDQTVPFDGKCLPKDTLALAKFAERKLNYTPEFLNQVLDSCERIGKIRQKE